MKTLLTPLVLFVFAVSIFRPAEIAAQSPDFAVLTFNRVGSLIYLTATADELTGSFLIDTGYRGVLLNQEYFEGERTDLFLQGTNGLGGRICTTEVDLSLGLLNVEGVAAGIADLRALERSVGVHLMGIIGSTFLAEYEVMIDYEINNLILIKLDETGERMVDLPTISPPTDTLPLRFKGHLPVVDLKVGDNELRLAIDTGASANLFQSNLLSKIEDWVWGVQDQHLRGFGAARRRAKVGMVSKAFIEDLPLRSMRTLFSNIGHINRDLIGPNLDGILGYEFLHQYKTAYNYKKQEMYVWQHSKEKAKLPVEYTVKNEEIKDLSSE